MKSNKTQKHWHNKTLIRKNTSIAGQVKNPNQTTSPVLWQCYWQGTEKATFVKFVEMYSTTNQILNNKTNSQILWNRWKWNRSIPVVEVMSYEHPLFWSGFLSGQCSSQWSQNDRELTGQDRRRVSYRSQWIRCMCWIQVISLNTWILCPRCPWMCRPCVCPWSKDQFTMIPLIPEWHTIHRK